MEPNLNNENCFDAIKSSYPKAFEKFSAWIDEYKEKVGWKNLFQRKENNLDVDRIKFHEIPIEMQMFVLIRFKSEVILGERWSPEVLTQCIGTIGEMFAALEEKLKL